MEDPAEMVAGSSVSLTVTFTTMERTGHGRVCRRHRDAVARPSSQSPASPWQSVICPELSTLKSSLPSPLSVYIAAGRCRCRRPSPGRLCWRPFRFSSTLLDTDSSSPNDGWPFSFGLCLRIVSRGATGRVGLVCQSRPRRSPAAVSLKVVCVSRLRYVGRRRGPIYGAEVAVGGKMSSVGSPR